MTDDYRFPDGFLWGSATSAYQIEGSPLADGAGPSIWQRFVHTPGLTANGDTGDVACDHYNRYRDDVALMAALGLKAYRFSIAWGARPSARAPAPVNAGRPRFLRPAGRRACSKRGSSRLRPSTIGTCRRRSTTAAAGSTPTSPAGSPIMAKSLFRRLDGRVKRWATLNEPWVVTDGGYLHGALAPGHSNLFEAPIASRNLMRAHGAAVQRYRAVGRQRDRPGRQSRAQISRPATAPRIAPPPRRSDAYMNRAISRSRLRPRLPARSWRRSSALPGATGATRISRWPPSRSTGSASIITRAA